jgi:CubicO group peptidase (beta-lactamase class C family)
MFVLLRRGAWLACLVPATWMMTPSLALAQVRPELGERPLITENGVALVVPRGWSIAREPHAVTIRPPETGSAIAFIDLAGGEPDAALAKAWATYGVAPPPVRSARERPVRDGWDQIRLYSYAAGPGRTISARALRRADRWTVVLQDMSDDLVEKRDAQLELIFGRLLAPGYQRESFAGRKAHKIDPKRLTELVDLIETGRRDLEIPGVGFGLIQDGHVVFQGGFGARELGKPAAVDADTAFMIGSNGKALTTLMLAKLVERGLFDWDTPVASLWPAFWLGDLQTTAQIRVRHLVCACTGLPREDYPWIFQGDEAQASTVLTWLSAMRPTSAFGELYQYSNLLAAAGGYLGAYVRSPSMELGAAYDAAMQALVFDPLGMSRTTFDYARALAGNHASPHAQDIDGVQRVAVMGMNEAGTASRPDGGEWSTTRDMLRYVRMELARGKLPSGRRYIAEAPLLARYTPQVAEGSDEYYGMGLKTDFIWGVRVIHHGGTQYGYRADIYWLPEYDVGAVLLINSDSGAALRSAFRRRLLEVLFDGERRAETDLANAAKAYRASKGQARDGLTAPAEGGDRLIGRYRSAELGPLTIRRDGAALVFDTGGWASEVASRRGKAGTMTYVTITPGADGYEFEVDKDGNMSISEGGRTYTFASL